MSRRELDEDGEERELVGDGCDCDELCDLDCECECHELEDDAA